MKKEYVARRTVNCIWFKLLFWLCPTYDSNIYFIAMAVIKSVSTNKLVINACLHVKKYVGTQIGGRASIPSQTPVNLYILTVWKLLGAWNFGWNSPVLEYPRSRPRLLSLTTNAGSAQYFYTVHWCLLPDHTQSTDLGRKEIRLVAPQHSFFFLCCFWLAKKLLWKVSLGAWWSI